MKSSVNISALSLKPNFLVKILKTQNCIIIIPVNHVSTSNYRRTCWSDSFDSSALVAWAAAGDCCCYYQLCYVWMLGVFPPIPNYPNAITQRII